MTYTIYQNGNGIAEAAKVGWSWPAFFFTWLWAAYKRMWIHAAGTFIALLLLGFIVGLIMGPSAILICLVAQLFACFAYGNDGELWHAATLVASGYEKVQKVEAQSPEHAVSVFFKEARSGSQPSGPPREPITSSDDDEEYYIDVANELRTTGPREGLWLKAMTQCGGNETEAKMFYIRWRVDQLKQEDLRSAPPVSVLIDGKYRIKCSKCGENELIDATMLSDKSQYTKFEPHFWYFSIRPYLRCGRCGMKQTYYPPRFTNWGASIG